MTLTVESCLTRMKLFLLLLRAKNKRCKSDYYFAMLWICRDNLRRRIQHFAVSLSKFAQLRPKWCVFAGSSGTHSVCVCTIHQNFKTMLDAARLAEFCKDTKNPIKDHNDCIKFVLEYLLIVEYLCRNSQPNCYLNECISCPKIEKFSDYVIQILESRNIEEVIFSTWQATDRCTLKKECLSSDDFDDELCDRLKTLIPHHFISKTQSKYVSERKENLNKGEVLVQSDFSENYLYIAQDAA